MEIVFLIKVKARPGLSPCTEDMGQRLRRTGSFHLCFPSLLRTAAMYTTARCSEVITSGGGPSLSSLKLDFWGRKSAKH